MPKEERRALPAFALEDYYLNKKVEEANKKAEMFKLATKVAKIRETL